MGILVAHALDWSGRQRSRLKRHLRLSGPIETGILTIARTLIGSWAVAPPHAGIHTVALTRARAVTTHHAGTTHPIARTLTGSMTVTMHHAWIHAVARTLTGSRAVTMHHAGTHPIARTLTGSRTWSVSGAAHRAGIHAVARTIGALWRLGKHADGQDRTGEKEGSSRRGAKAHAFHGQTPVRIGRMFVCARGQTLICQRPNEPMREASFRRTGDGCRYAAAHKRPGGSRWINRSAQRTDSRGPRDIGPRS